MTPEQDQKIERLLQVTGAAPDKIELARKNYERLLEEKGEAEIDRRIKKFKVVNARFAKWRIRKVHIRTILVGRGVLAEDHARASKEFERMSDKEVEGLGRSFQAVLKGHKNLNRGDKIYYILREIGVPYFDFEICKPNLEKLSNAELDKKYHNIVERSERVAEWRRTRGSPVPQPTVHEILEPL